LEHSGRGEIAPIGLASFAMTAVAGFVDIVRRVNVGQAIGIGVVYFPTTLGLMFLEAVFLDAQFYGNTF
jgi:hypothetical protein